MKIAINAGKLANEFPGIRASARIHIISTAKYNNRAQQQYHRQPKIIIRDKKESKHIDTDQQQQRQRNEYENSNNN